MGTTRTRTSSFRVREAIAASSQQSPKAPWQISVRVAPPTMNCGFEHSSPGLFHTIPLVLDVLGPSSLKPRDSGAAGKDGSENRVPLPRHWLLSASKSWLRYLVALAFVPNPAACALFLARVEATPDIFSLLKNQKNLRNVQLSWCFNLDYCDSPPQTF